MGNPPPPNFPAPSAPSSPGASSSSCSIVSPQQGGAGAGAGLSFPASPKASICGFSLGLPRISIGLFIKLPFTFPPKLPIPFLSFKLSCKLPNPIDVTAGLNSPYGGCRVVTGLSDPDNDETSF